MEQGERIWWSLALIVVAIKGALIWTGWPETSLVADDAYYYFVIARHLATGLGPTFDGLAATNGFHPLWQLVLVPLWRLFELGDWTGVRWVLSLSVVVDVLTARLLFSFVRRQASERAGLIAAAAWLLGPLTFFGGMRGMEASVSAFCVLWALRQFAGGTRDARGALAMGCCIALAGWARTDNLLTLGAATTLTLVLGGSLRQQWRSRLHYLATTAVVAGAGMSPWFLWNRVEFGHFVQVSGLVKRVTEKIIGRLPVSFDTPLAAVDTVAHAFFAPVVVSVRWLTGEQFAESRIYLIVSAVLLLWLALALRGLAGVWRDKPWVRWGLSYLLIHALVFGLVWRSYASWYAHPWVLVLIALLALSLRRRAVPKLANVLLVLLGVGLVVSYATREPHGAHGPRERFRPLLEQAMQVLPEGGTLGAFDAGAVAFVAGEYPSLRVVNLDCLVNNAAFDAVEEGRYGDYVVETVDLFLQPPTRARMFLGPEKFEKMMSGFKAKVEARERARRQN